MIVAFDRMYAINKKLNFPEKIYNNYCKMLLNTLPAKALAFIYAYYWDYQSESQIASALGYSNKSSVAEYKKRVFAQIRMYAIKKNLMTPRCLTEDFKKYNKTLYYFFRSIQKSSTINRLSDDRYLKPMMKNFINETIEYIEKVKSNCHHCKRHEQCNLNLKRRKNKRKLFFLQIEDTLENNLRLHIKTLTYLIDWKNFHICDGDTIIK